VLLVAPTAFAEGVITTVANGQIPIAQVPGAGKKSPPQAAGYDARTLLAFAERHAGHDTYLLATEGAAAWNLIIESGKNIVPLDGFGTALTAKELASWVAKGEIRYFLLQPGNGALGGASELTANATRICTPVPAREWGGGSGRVGLGGTNETLYDCAGKAGQLMAAANSTHKRLRLPTHKPPR
jgi:hypothetical protein